MGGVIVWKYCAWLALFASPAVPLALAGRSLLKGRRSRRLGVLPVMVIASLSLIWFVAATANFRLVGPLYGMLRYAVTGGNLGAMLLCALICVVAGARRGPRAAPFLTCVACLMLAVEWTLLGVAYR